MDLTKIKDMLINPVADKVAELLSPRIAKMVTDILKQEILEAQKYRIDKEFELKQRKQNLQYNNFCPQCNKFTTNFEHTTVHVGGRKDGYHYFCDVCKLKLGAYLEKK